MQQEREILVDELKNDPPSLLVAVFTATDSVSHMFWRLIDPQHPALRRRARGQIRRRH